MAHFIKKKNKNKNQTLGAGDVGKEVQNQHRQLVVGSIIENTDSL